MKRVFNWDGEKIKESVTEEDKKHTPKDILNGLDGVRGQINQMENAGAQLDAQIATNKASLTSAKAFEKDLMEFESKCMEIQKEKLEFTIKQLHATCYETASKDAEKEIAKTPDAYNEAQRKQLPFLKYQKLLATDKKVSEKIAKRVITKYLYEEPIFENPFK